MNDIDSKCCRARMIWQNFMEEEGCLEVQLLIFRKCLFWANPYMQRSAKPSPWSPSALSTDGARQRGR